MGLRATVLEVKTLGTLDLRWRDGSVVQSVLAQPKRVALLLYLTLARPRGMHQRDTLLNLFWGERDEQSARKALRQALYYLRSSLHEDVIVTIGDNEVGLAPDRIWCDALELQRLAAAGDHAAALSLYAGPLLPGFHVEDAPEFNDWLEAERAAATGVARETARAGAEVLRDRGDLPGAIKLARTALAISPHDEASLRQLMNLLHLAGEEATALREYDQFSRALQTAYDLSPSTETRSVAESLRVSGDPAPQQIESERPTPVVSAHQQTDAQVAPHVDPVVATRATPLRRKPAWRNAVTAAVFSLASVIVVFIVQGGDPQIPAVVSAPSELNGIAVLPIHNLSPAPDSSAHVVEGIHYAIGLELLKVSGLRVIGRSSVSDLRRHPAPAQRARDALGVRYVLDISARVSGHDLLMTAQLQDVVTHDLVWSDTYENRKLVDLGEIQSSIAGEVARALHAHVVRGVDASTNNGGGTTSNEALSYFLRGSDPRFAGYEEDAIRYSIQMYENAISLDPSYAEAWARLAMRHAEYYWFVHRTSARAAEVGTALQKARALAPDDPEICLAAGLYQYRIRTDYAAALRELECAEQSDPRVKHTYAAIYRRSGEWGRALATWREAYALDPGSAEHAMEVGITLWLMGSYDDAEEHLERAIELDPEFATPYAVLSWLHIAQNSLVDALNTFERAAKAGIVLADKPYLRHSWVTAQLLSGEYLSAAQRVSLENWAVAVGQWYYHPHDLVIGQFLRLAGDSAGARTRFVAAKQALEQALTTESGNAAVHSALGLTLAYLGERDAALRHGKHAVSILPIEKDAWDGCYRLEELALSYTLLGDHVKAAELYRQLLSTESHLSRNQVKLDPRLTYMLKDSRAQAVLRTVLDS